VDEIMSKNNSEYLIERNDNVYEVVIGLEVHAQVTSNSKLFSSSSTKFGAEPNTQVSLVDAAFPGMLPVINEFCVKQAIKFHNINTQSWVRVMLFWICLKVKNRLE
jgi:aspartyl-tRNA(Asn)/glutamyl-tRNA(Gln) amidotransferase subunit B